MSSGILGSDRNPGPMRSRADCWLVKLRQMLKGQSLRETAFLPCCVRTSFHSVRRFTGFFKQMRLSFLKSSWNFISRNECQWRETMHILIDVSSLKCCWAKYSSEFSAKCYGLSEEKYIIKFTSEPLMVPNFSCVTDFRDSVEILLYLCTPK